MASSLIKDPIYKYATSHVSPDGKTYEEYERALVKALRIFQDEGEIYLLRCIAHERGADSLKKDSNGLDWYERNLIRVHELTKSIIAHEPVWSPKYIKYKEDHNITLKHLP